MGTTMTPKPELPPHKRKTHRGKRGGKTHGKPTPPQHAPPGGLAELLAASPGAPPQGIPQGPPPVAAPQGIPGAPPAGPDPAMAPLIHALMKHAAMQGA